MSRFIFIVEIFYFISHFSKHLHIHVFSMTYIHSLIHLDIYNTFSERTSTHAHSNIHMDDMQYVRYLIHYYIAESRDARRHLFERKHRRYLFSLYRQRPEKRHAPHLRYSSHVIRFSQQPPPFLLWRKNHA